MFGRITRKLQYLFALLTEPETAEETLAKQYEDNLREGRYVDGISPNTPPKRPLAPSDMDEFRKRRAQDA